MRTIAHISDLRFGGENPRIADALASELRERAPDVLAISGDLTQRATRAQFAAARAWLAHLPQPQVAVPGDHDLPADVGGPRPRSPLRRFHSYICGEELPVHQDEELVVVGVCDVAGDDGAQGRQPRSALERAMELLARAPRGRFKVVVAHHPVPTSGNNGSDAALVARLRTAIEALQRAGVDLMLTGDLHLGHIADTPARRSRSRRKMLVAQAGSALSVRTRGQPNAYNWVAIDGDRVRCEARGWDGSGFVTTRVTDSSRVRGAWALVPPEPAPS